MNITEVKNNFHELIDNLNDAGLLINFYEGLLHSADNSLRKEFSDEGKRELLLAFEESENENELIDHEMVKEKIKNGFKN